MNLLQRRFIFTIFISLLMTIVYFFLPNIHQTFYYFKYIIINPGLKPSPKKILKQNSDLFLRTKNEISVISRPTKTNPIELNNDTTVSSKLITEHNSSKKLRRLSEALKRFTRASNTVASVNQNENYDGNSTVSEQLLNKSENAVNPHDFAYLIQEPNLCSTHPSVFLLIYIHTSPDHFKRRMFIRDTWGGSKLFSSLHTIVIFLLGLSNQTDPAQNRIVQQKIKRESERYRDIVQEDFVDTYRNMTLKNIAGLKWITNHCPQAYYILKSDDDVFINTFSLVRHISNQHQHNKDTANTISCRVWANDVAPMRDKRSKWYVSVDEYPGDNYGTYCSGAAYLLSADLAPKLYAASLQNKFFWIDDVYVTGILARKIGAEFHPYNSLFTFDPIMEEQEDKILDGQVIFGHLPDGHLSRMYSMWRQIEAENFPS